MSFKQALILSGALLLLTHSCGTPEKLAAIQRGEVAPSFRLPIDTTFVPQIKRASVARDTLTIKGEHGEDLIIMKAYKADDEGLVVTEELEAAFITAKSRNIAVRNGKVNLAFQIIVPAELRDEAWQLRFYPQLYVQGDTTRLEPVLITGEYYRQRQLKGYEQYERFLASILPDSTVRVDLKNLEIFLSRNIPELFALKRDTTEVSDSVFRTIYGVSEQQAVEHYTHVRHTPGWQLRRNEKLIGMKDEVFKRRVRMPIVTEGIRLDTVIVDENGAFVYNYTQTLNTRPGLRKADVTLLGDIYEGRKCIYSMPESAPITFYISSLSAFAEDIIRYKKKVIERRVGANMSYNIEFEKGYADIRPALADNARELGLIEKNIKQLLFNEVFDLDSIVVEAHASPEGFYKVNNNLSKRRGEAVAAYVDKYIRAVQDSVRAEGAFQVNEKGEIINSRSSMGSVRLNSRWGGEYWEGLNKLVEADGQMSAEDKEDYRTLASLNDIDLRDQRMSRRSYYPYLSETLYPKLRAVDFNFYMHRKDMVKDTVHTTVVDSTYLEGVAALRDMNYEKAVEILALYKDINTAVAYSALDRNQSALSILTKQDDKATVNYLLALIYWRLGNENEAVEHYLKACRQDPSYVYRGNLDPEISVMVQLYGLSKEESEEDFE